MRTEAILPVTIVVLAVVAIVWVWWRALLNEWRKEGFEAPTTAAWAAFLLVSSSKPLPWWLLPWVRWTEGCDEQGRVYIWKEWKGYRYDIRPIGIRRIRSRTEYHKAMNGEDY